MKAELDREFIRRHRDQTESRTDSRTCEWPACTGEGDCRAPVSRHELRTFRWFCKQHAREFNKSWNYYEGMSDDEVEADVRRDTVWRRPTWRLGSNNLLGTEYGGFDPTKFDDPLGIFEQNDPRAKDLDDPPLASATAEQRNAIAIFSLQGAMTADNIKQRYKELVKMYHPDSAERNKNLNQTESDDRIKLVNQAYRILLDFVGA